MIEDRKLTRTVTLHCNNGEYKTVEQVVAVQLRWNSETPEVDPNPLGFVNATPWRLVATDPRQIEYERASAFATAQQLAAVREERDKLRAACVEGEFLMRMFLKSGLDDSFAESDVKAVQDLHSKFAAALSPAQEPQT